MTFYKDLITLEKEIDDLLDKNVNHSIIAKYLSYIIVGDIYSKYNNDLELMLKIKCPLKENYGLINLLLKMKSRHEDTPRSYIEPLIVPIPSFNLTYKNQKNLCPTVDFLYNNLLPFNYEKSNLILDLYIDETFGENSKIYELAKIIPYANNWYGFIYN